MKKSLSLLSLIVAVSAHAAESKKQSCTYHFDPAGTETKWMAFKTTEKVAVGGAFTKTTLKPRRDGTASLMEIVNGAKFTIPVDSVNTGNPARDATLKAAFFNKLAKKEITGEVKKIGAIPRGRMEVELQLNGVTKMVPFDYSVSEDGKLEATSQIDMMDFNMKTPFESLNQACKALHAGKDGVSKTWTEVGLQIVSQFKKTCH